MEPYEFKRQLNELRNVVADGIAYFTAWQGLAIEDEITVQSLNRYRGFITPSKNSLLWYSLLQFSKVFDKDPRTVSLPNLVKSAQSNMYGLTPHCTEKDLSEVGNKINENEELLQRLKTFRDQRLAHHDATLTENNPLFFGELEELVSEIISMYNLLSLGHDRSTTRFEDYVHEVEMHTADIVHILRKDFERDHRRIRRTD